MSRLKQFKAESQKVLDLMINSIYTNKEIFLREYISNASDAMDKLYARRLSDDKISFSKDDLQIEVSVNKELRLIKIKDYGIGMSREELEQNLGTIAYSDSQIVKESLQEDSQDIDIIGQFGVGFYSGFMVAKEVRVLSKSDQDEAAYGFFSNGIDGYKIEKIDKNERGTEVYLFIKEGEEYDKYCEVSTIRQLIKKYSDYVRYPIKMHNDDNELETINSMIPLWKRSKQEITEEEYHSFYQSHFNDFQPPKHVIHMNVEGNTSFTALLFIPSHTPYNYYTQEFKRGLELYSRSVFIEKEVTSLLSEGFGFVKGIVDSSDLNLNISRETLQNDQQLSTIAKRIHRKLKTELLNLLQNEREKYLEIYQEFAQSLKFGCYVNFGLQKDDYQDLLLFNSSHDDQLTTLSEYVSRMAEDQQEIFYVSAPTLTKAKQLPVFETFSDKNIEVLFLLSDIDEFAIKMIQQYQEKPFKSINQGDFSESESDKQQIAEEMKSNQALLDQIQAALSDQVSSVRLTNRLKSHPVVLVADEGISFEMEKVMSVSPDKNQHLKAGRILEINPHHPVFNKLKTLDSDLVSKYAKLLYNQACLIEGLPIDDVSEFSSLLSDLMIH